MNTRYIAPLGMITMSLGVFALFAGARGYPILLITTGGIVLAWLCFRPGEPRTTMRGPVDHVPSEFSMPPVDACPPERLREARQLAARVVASSSQGESPRRSGP